MTTDARKPQYAMPEAVSAEQPKWGYTRAEQAAEDEHNALGDRVLDREQTEVGNVAPEPEAAPATGETPPAREEPLKITLKKRLEREGRWSQVEPVRDQMMRDAKSAFPDKESRQAWVYAELDRMYPPLATEQPHTEVSDIYRKVETAVHHDGQIQGLSDLPAGWPQLPANASLASEIGWVQANRLRIVQERPGGATRVQLGQALSPAPSWAALGWLETSIRSYAKFVDVAAKVSGDSNAESEVMRRERKSIEELEAIINEMMPQGACPNCGKPMDE